jgi:hypothetical protein
VFAESGPILLIPAGYARHLSGLDTYFSSTLNLRHFIKSVEQLIAPEALNVNP